MVARAGITCSFPVVSERRRLLCPLEVAVESMRAHNAELRRAAVGGAPEELWRRALGTLDAAVMGGVRRYEDAFLTERYADRHPEHRDLLRRLRRLMVAQLKLVTSLIPIFILAA